MSVVICKNQTPTLRRIKEILSPLFGRNSTKKESNISDNPLTVSEQKMESEKKYFLNDESFALLTEAQGRIKDATEVTPTLRKLNNMLITPEFVEIIIEKFIKNHQAKF